MMSICISYMVQNSVSTGTKKNDTTVQGGSRITNMDDVTRFANVSLNTNTDLGGPREARDQLVVYVL